MHQAEPSSELITAPFKPQLIATAAAVISTCSTGALYRPHKHDLYELFSLSPA
jgi:hypothetical protein